MILNRFWVITMRFLVELTVNFIDSWKSIFASIKFMKAICLILILLSYADLTFAKPIALFVYQTPTAEEFKSGDLHRYQQLFKSYQIELKLLNTELLPVQLEKLKDFPHWIEQNIKKNDTITMVIFKGHGNDEEFILDKNKRLTGNKMAEFVYYSFSQTDHHANSILFYFSACNCGQNNQKEKSFHFSFASRIKDLQEKYGQIWSEVYTIAHRYYSTSVANENFKKVGTLELFYFKTGLPHLIQNLQLSILYIFGSKAFQHSYLLTAGFTTIAIPLLAILHGDQILDLAQKLFILSAVIVPKALHWLFTSPLRWTQQLKISNNKVERFSDHSSFNEIVKYIAVQQKQAPLLCEKVLQQKHNR